MQQYQIIKLYLQARVGNNERGASLIEYVLLIALILVVCVAAVEVFNYANSGN